MKRGKAFNPYSVQRLGPRGAKYVFAEGESVGSFIEFLNKGTVVELVGREGAGKSTLLFTIESELRTRGLRTVVFRCREDVVRLPLFWRWQLRGADYCFLDGAEVLGGSHIRALVSACKRRSIALLLTTHHPLGIGVVYPVSAKSESLHQLIRQLTDHPPDQHRVEELLISKEGDARAALFALYDEFERSG